MAALSLGEIQDFVRTSLDTDATELPDSVLNVYIREGAYRAAHASNQWQFYGVEYTITTIANDQSYQVTGSNLYPGIDAQLAAIVDVRGPTWQLVPVAHQAIRDTYRQTAVPTGNPTSWSEHGQMIYLWPTPASAAVLTISGYRQMADWQAGGTGAAPDLPEDFHDVLCFHALARGWAQQSDPDMATYYDRMFDDQIKQLKKRFGSGMAQGPMVLNGGTGVDSYSRNGLGPLIYPFE